MRSNSRQVGARMESSARAFLEREGLRFVEGNFRSRFGEIDLIMRDGDTIVFVEVRPRKSNRFGTAAETVDRRKQLKLIRTAQYYLRRHPRLVERPCRFDVVATSTQEGQIDRWIRHAFVVEQS